MFFSLSELRVMIYARLQGTKMPGNVYRFKHIDPIFEDLCELDIYPTRDTNNFFVPIDHDCTTLRGIEILPSWYKPICLFMITNMKGVIVKPDEQSVWIDMFNQINYEIKFHDFRPVLVGSKAQARTFVS